MPTKTIKGKIVDYEKIETYDEDGIKLINYWIKVNNEKYTLTLPRGSNVYFENNDEVILDVNENNIAIAGLCPKKGFKWGKTKAIDGLVQPTDRYEIADSEYMKRLANKLSRIRISLH